MRRCTSHKFVVASETGERPGAQSRQQVAQLHRLQRALADVMESGSIGGWLETPNSAFGGLKPLEVIERGQVDRIWRMIFELQSGTPG